MSDKDNDGDKDVKKPSPVKGILFSLVSAILMGGVAAAVISFSPSSEPAANCPASSVAEVEIHDEEPTPRDYHDVVFVNMEPLVVSLGPSANSNYLKISISLETSKDHAKDMDHLKPKFRDVLNSYLRAVDERDLADPAAMTRIRSQMLRRLQLVGSVESITDVLITDFVLN